MVRRVALCGPKLVGVIGLTVLQLLSGCGQTPPPVAGPDDEKTRVEAGVTSYETIPTAPRTGPSPVKKHLEFGDDMADVLAKYLREAKAGSDLIAKAEAAAPRGDADMLKVPLPEGDSVRLARDIDELFYRYRMRDVDAYLAHTKDVAAARQPAVDFVRGYIESYMSRPGAPAPERLRELAQGAIDAGSTDPLVRTYRTFLRMGYDDSAIESETDLLAVADELKESPYPHVMQVFVRSRLCKLGRELGRPTDDRLTAAVQAFVAWLAAEQPDPQWRACVLSRYEQAASLLTPPEREAVFAACLRSGTADPWVMHYLLGIYYNDLGWHYRGNGFSNEVTDEGWRRMSDNIPRGTQHLRYAWALDPTLPHPARKMILLCGSGYDSEATPYDWFVRATSAQFDDWESYNWLLEMLSRRWGGSPEAQYAFAEQCLETDRWDTHVPQVAIHALEKTSAEKVHDPAKAKEIIGRYLEKRAAARDANPGKPLAVDASWARSALALRMLREEMYKEGVTELQAMGNDMHLRTFQYAGVMGELYINSQVAKVVVDDKATDELTRFLANPWPPGTPETMFKRPRKLIADFGPRATDDLSRRFFLHAERVTNQLEQRARNEWTDLRFDEKVPGWELYVDRWKVDPKTNSLSVWRNEAGAAQLRIRPIADFRPPIELELELEVLEPSPYPHAFGLHWVRHMWGASEWSPAQPLFGIEPRLEAGASGPTRRDYAVMPVGKDRLEYAALPTTGPHKLRLRLSQDAYEFQVDGLGWSRRLPEPLPSDAFMGIGEPFPNYTDDGTLIPSGGFKISNVRLRTMWDPMPSAQ